ncbi:hypothetical protein SAMN05877831_104189 [Rhodobacter maris]|uniref:Uncharacterized protein n=1 Tax=Rhodobacter maris TaxID=446682 RepID=A0A285SEF6_9RHOB|nr:hypothetical protein SAMN05877831_104189 [Rhodobacter maris]
MPATFALKAVFHGLLVACSIMPLQENPLVPAVQILQPKFLTRGRQSPSQPAGTVVLHSQFCR